MKLFFDSIYKDGRWWRCKLPNKQGMWSGCGDTPIEAYKNYLEIVKHIDDSEGQDYIWCKERGLLK